MLTYHERIFGQYLGLRDLETELNVKVAQGDTSEKTINRLKGVKSRLTRFSQMLYQGVRLRILPKGEGQPSEADMILAEGESIKEEGRSLREQYAALRKSAPQFTRDFYHYLERKMRGAMRNIRERTAALNYFKKDTGVLLDFTEFYLIPELKENRRSIAQEIKALSGALSLYASRFR